MRWIDLRKHFFYGLPPRKWAAALKACLLFMSLILGTLGLHHGSKAGLPAHTANSSQESRDVDTLQALGAAARERNAWADAEDYLLRAQYQLHREFGVTTAKQQPIVEGLATLSIQSENYQKANQLFEFNHFVAQKTTLPASMIQADIALANWYLQSGQFERAAALLEPSEADDFTGTNFIPERALLRLDIARFTRHCCSPKEIMATVEQAEHSGLPEDSLQQFRQAAVQLLIVSGHNIEAASILKAVASSQNAPPRMIAGKRRIMHRDPNRELSQIERRQIEQLLQLRGMGSDPRMNDALWNRGPQTVTISSSDEFLPIERPEQSELGANRQFHALTGHPLRFREKDLRQILPAKYLKKANLESLEIVMVFAITPEGRVRNIRFEGPYDRQIKELMRDTLKAVRFQPELRNGKPILREDFRLVQSFPLQGEA